MTTLLVLAMDCLFVSACVLLYARGEKHKRRARIWRDVSNQQAEAIREQSLLIKNHMLALRQQEQWIRSRGVA